MKKANLYSPKGFMPVSDKNVFSFNPYAYGVLMKNIFTGECLIAERNRVVPLTFEQAEKVIEINFE